MNNNFDLKKFLAENRANNSKAINEIDPDLLRRAQGPAPKNAAASLAKRKKEIDAKRAGKLQVSKGSNAEQEQKVIDFANAAIALMDEQPGTSAEAALQTVLEA